MHSKICHLLCAINPAGSYMLKVNNRNTRTRCDATDVEIPGMNAKTKQEKIENKLKQKN